MSDYVKSTNFASKDTLSSGNPLKIVKGTEIDTEFTNIATAVATKLDSASPTITGGAIDDTTIGATTASTGAFTTLAASGNVTLSGGTANGVAYLNSSKVVTSGSALTFDGTNLATSGSVILNNAQYYHSKTSGGTNIRMLGINSGNTAYVGPIDSGPGDTILNASSSSVNIQFYASGSEQMRLNSTGLGIGTSSPAQKLDVSGQALVTNLYLRSDDSDVSWGAGSGSRPLIRGNTTNNTLIFYTASTPRLTLDSSGNLGLGVTPSAWQSAYKVFEFASAGSAIWSSGVSDARISANMYYNGGYKYAGTGYATRFEQSSGQFAWFNAPSGTAGNTITFTQAMTLDASGNLLVGSTSFNQSARVAIRKDSTTAPVIELENEAASGYMAKFTTNGESVVGSISFGVSSVAYNTSSDYRLKNITGPITTSGAYIDSLNPVEGTWKADGSTFVGLIAHEVQEASRTSVATGVKDGDEMQAMDYSSSEIIANLIAEVQSLRKRLATLESK